MTSLEEDYDKNEGDKFSIEQFRKLIKFLKGERDAMTENFRVTNQAYVLLDKQNRELTFYINQHMPK